MAIWCVKSYKSHSAYISIYCLLFVSQIKASLYQDFVDLYHVFNTSPQTKQPHHEVYSAAVLELLIISDYLHWQMEFVTVVFSEDVQMTRLRNTESTKTAY